jgi:hypothetical protein
MAAVLLVVPFFKEYHFILAHHTSNLECTAATKCMYARLLLIIIQKHSVVCAHLTSCTLWNEKLKIVAI